MKPYTEKELKKIIKRLRVEDITYVVSMFMHTHKMKRITGNMQIKTKKGMKYYYIDAKKTKNLKEVER